MDNVIYSRTVSHPDKKSSRWMACICLTEETNGYALFEVIRLGGETQEKKLLCWHFKWDRDGAIEHAVEYIRSAKAAAAVQFGLDESERGGGVNRQNPFRAPGRAHAA